jgi:trehalose utilization protein
MNRTRPHFSAIQPHSKINRRLFLEWAGLTAAGSFLAGDVHAAAARRVVVWAEGTAQEDKVYPQDINTAIAEGLRKHLEGWTIETASLADPEQGCSEASLAKCDVLIWWGHKKHNEVKDEHVARIVRRVKEEGMGFIAVHSAHFAKPNRRLMGSRCGWAAYENDGCKLKLVIKDPSHPIVKGVKEFTLPQIERYSEPYQVPPPQSVPLEGVYVYPDGKEEPTRVGLCWTIGKGRMFYFVPGHETYRDFYMDEVNRIMANAVTWAAPSGS